jgi:hypothetical protein
LTALFLSERLDGLLLQKRADTPRLWRLSHELSCLPTEVRRVKKIATRITPERESSCQQIQHKRVHLKSYLEPKKASKPGCPKGLVPARVIPAHWRSSKKRRCWWKSPENLRSVESCYGHHCLVMDSVKLCQGSWKPDCK